MGAALGGFAMPIIGSVVSSLIGGALTKKPSAPAATPAPTVASPTPMPDPMVQKSKQRRQAASMFSDQMGAADTVLTGGSDTLG